MSINGLAGHVVPGENADFQVALTRVLGSQSFAGSPRCREFLQYVGERVLQGEADSVKERAIAISVFGRPPDYDSSDDSLVRVKAGEVRRRLAKYYETEGQDDPIRIRIPVGGYVPVFEAVRTAAAPAPTPERVARWWSTGRFRLALAALGSVLLLAAFLVWGAAPVDPVEEVWRPVLREKEPLLIFIPVPATTRSLGPEQRVVRADDRVGIGPAAGALRVALYAASKNRQVDLRIGKELDFTDLKKHPSMLFGAFSSEWPPLMSRGLPFELRRNRECGGGVPGGCIADLHSGETWSATNLREDMTAERDVAIAARVMDTRTGRPILFAAGITTYGTLAAADFLLSGDDLSALKQLAGPEWAKPNFQAVIEVPIIHESPGRPRIVTYRFW